MVGWALLNCALRCRFCEGRLALTYGITVKVTVSWGLFVLRSLGDCWPICLIPGVLEVRYRLGFLSG